MKVVKEETCMIKICQECGKEFETTNGMQKFCKRQHYRRCVVCGNLFEISAYHLTAKDAKTTCSKKCSCELRKNTNMKRYGGVAPSCSSEIRDKMEATNLERYGVKHAAQADIFKEKSKQTSLDRYGEEYYARTSEGKQRLSDRWADSEFKNTVIEHRVRTNVERYGFENPMQSLAVRTKCSEAKMTDPTKSSAFVTFKQDPRNFILSLKLDHKPTIQELSKYIGVNDSTVGCYIHLSGCEDIIQEKVSIMEQEVIDFLQTLDPKMTISHCDRSIITPYELDIYLPEYNLGIECNPTATHNSTVNVFDRNSTPLSPSYHQMKTNLCEAKGVRLIHVFGYEWKHNRSGTESTIRNAIFKNDRKLYARKCEVRNVSSPEASIFLEANHRQGKVGSSVRLGLYYQDELAAIMTFGKLRSTIGKQGEGYELLRFCSCTGTTVIGGASKLFKHFITEYNPQLIRSFSDRAHTSGKLYKTLGFEEVNRSSAGYVWVCEKTDKAYHRMNAQKQNIRKFLHDDSIDLSKTEREIMTEHGFVQVYDSGTITWEWKNPCIVENN